MQLSELKKHCLHLLLPSQGLGESEAIFYRTFEHLTGESFHKFEVLDLPFSSELEQKCIALIQEVAEGNPLQYVLGEAWFYNHLFQVNPAVLIPRPETEELVHLMLKSLKGEAHPRILDIGTGSGCIPISLKLARPDAELWGVDISGEALLVAKQNALRLGAEVNFLSLDILADTSNPSTDFWDLIVSNPPYIPRQEYTEMETQVRDKEPQLALFVEDEDPLIFYREIAIKAKKWLKPTGHLFFELHYRFAKETELLLRQQGFQTEIYPDMQGKPRMLKAWN